MGIQEDVASGNKSPWILSFGDTTTCGCETILKFIAENTISRPKINAASSGERFSVIGIDNLLATVQDQDVCCTNFKSKIDDVAILPGGFVAVGEENGTLTIGIVEEGGRFKVKQSANTMFEVQNSKDAAFVRILFQITEENEAQAGSVARVIALSSRGLLMVFSNIILINEDLDLSKIKVEKMMTPHETVSDVVVLKDRIITVGSGTDCLAMYTTDNGQLVQEDVVSLDYMPALVKIHALDAADVFLTVDDKGQFCLWDMLTLSVVYSFFVPDVTDFKLVELKTDGPFNIEDVKLVVVQDSTVRTLTLPSLKVTFESSVGASYTRLSKSLTTQDEIYVGECQTIDDGIESETIVFLRCYAETSPQKRLQRLIAKRRFEEAEKFAKSHGLPYNLDPVIIQSRMREAKDSFIETYNHLQHCKQQLLKNTSGDRSVREVLTELQEVEHRLESYKLVYGEDNYNQMDWEIFQHESPLAMCCQLLMINAEKAFTLWRCFQSELQKRLKPGLIQQLLQGIPSRVPSKMVVDWLCDAIIPCFIATDPEALNDMIEWIQDQISIMESQDKEAWPDQAIEVCGQLLKNLTAAVQCDVDDITDNNIQDVKTRMNCQMALTPLRTLERLLHGLRDLKVNYNCHLQLDVYRKETEASIVFRMLDKIAALDLLQSTLNDQVLPYIRNHNLVADEIFAQYVQDLLEKAVACRTQYSWEEKVKAIIRIIGDPKEKVVAVLNLLANVILPLPEFVENLVTEVTSTVQHPLVVTLSEKWSIKEADNIVFLHGLKPSDVKNSFQVKEVAKFIVAKGGPVAEAEKVLSAHKVSPKEDDELCRFICRLFVERNQIEQLSEYLRSLPKKIAMNCCQFVLSTAIYMMAEEGSPLIQEMKQTRLQYFESALKSAAILRTLTEDVFEIEEVEMQAQTIRQARNLEICHNIHVDEAVLNNRQECKVLLSKYELDESSSIILSLARLLNLADRDVLAVILSKFAEQSHNRAVSWLLSDMVSICQDSQLSTSHLIDLLAIVKGQEDVSAQELYLRIVQLLLTTCSKDTIQLGIGLCQLAYLMKDINSQCQDRTRTKNPESWDPNIFEELSPSLDLDLILPDLIMSLLDLKSGGDGWSQLESAVQYLCSEGQHQLALRTLLLAVSLIHPPAVLLPSEKQQISQRLPEQIQALASKITVSLITKILNCGQLDAELALSLVLVLPTKQGVLLLQTAIKSCGNNFKKLKRVSTVAFAVAEMLQEQKLIDSCHKVKIVAKWGNRLSKIGIPFKTVSFSNVTEILDALDKLIKSPHCDVDILLEYFSDFKLEENQLNTKLMQFFEVCLTRHSETGLMPAMLRKAQSVIHCMKKDNGNVDKMLQRQLQQTSAYNYEALEFLMEQIGDDNPDIQRGSQLLKYISLYRRCSPPTSVELKRCVDGVGVKDGATGEELDLLPEVSAVRLPYHHLMGKDRWTIITPELNPQTLGLWLDMAPVLNLSRDNFILKTASNLINAYTKQSRTCSSTSPNSASVSLEFHTLLNQVNIVLSQLEEKESAMYCCHALLEKLSGVGEKTIALQGCVFYATKWLNSIEEPQQKAKAQKAVEMFSKKLQVFSAHWALCKSGLQGVGELRKLLKQPEDLIQKIYSLPHVIESTETDVKDINKLCDEIADQQKTNLLDIRISLLDKWLLGATSAMDADQTMTFDVLTDDTGNENDDLKRALYMMASRDREKLLEHVASIANLMDGTVSPATHKRALFCLLKIGTEEEIARLFNQGLE